MGSLWKKLNLEYDCLILSLLGVLLSLIEHYCQSPAVSCFKLETF